MADKGGKASPKGTAEGGDSSSKVAEPAAEDISASSLGIVASDASKAKTESDNAQRDVGTEPSKAAKGGVDAAGGAEAATSPQDASPSLQKNDADVNASEQSGKAADHNAEQAAKRLSTRIDEAKNVGDSSNAAAASVSPERSATLQRSMSQQSDKAQAKVPSPARSPGRQTRRPVQPQDDEVADVARAFGVSASISGASAPAPTVPSPEKEQSVATPLKAESGASSLSSCKLGGLRIGKGPPPTTIASEEKPFDFNRFLEQMRHKSAAPVGEYVRSFIKGFTMKPYRAADQTKLIFDFLDFIALRMRECEIWKKVSDTEFENATEAMEKLVMNRLYNYTFSPAVRREGKWSVQTDDLERDRVLKQRVKIFDWIEEKHLDVPTGDHSKGFIDFAMQELVKINHYKAPRDKVICILNCCKVIFGLIRHLSSEENADTFIPILIFVVLRSNPDHLISNVEYISRFRNPDKLSSESGYYLSSLMGAIAFIETMDYTSLSNITQQEFEQNVEKAVVSMGAQTEMGDGYTEGGDAQKGVPAGMRTPSPSPTMANGEESARVLPVSAGAAALAEDTRAFFQRTGKAAKAGFGASLGGPMNALGRLFQEGLDGTRTPSGSTPPAGTGHMTPESPSLNAGNAGGASARARMWNLFGADANAQGTSPQQQASSQPNPYPVRQRKPSASRAPSSSTTPLSIGSWGRSMRPNDDLDPLSPQTEEMQQGRFVPLTAANGKRDSSHSRDMPSTGLSRPAQPQRQESIDPYSQDDEGGTLEGVHTPSDDGSVVENDSPAHAGALRSRLGELGGLLPSFMSEQRSTDSQDPSRAQARPSASPADPSAAPLDDDEASRAARQIDRAHVDAGVETLQSIFPHTEASVCRLVLEGCEGNVQAAIDKLLEMS